MEDNPRLYTTHCLPEKKPKLIGQPFIINGKPSIAFVRGDKIESYIPWEEAQEQIKNSNIPNVKVEF